VALSEDREANTILSITRDFAETLTRSRPRIKVLAGVVMLISCVRIDGFFTINPAHAGESERSVYTSKDSEGTMDLKTQIETLSEDMKSKIPEGAAAVMARALSELKSSGLEKASLQRGAKCPEFSLPNTQGKMVKVTELLRQGPVVLVFYRGGWCPYCNLTLRALQKSLDAIRGNGAQLVAISPQEPDQSLSTSEKNELTFEVLSDKQNKVAKSFGLVFTLPSDLVKLYGEFGIDLKKANGDDENELPLAATFVVAKNGTIEHAFVDADYKKRMEPAEIVSVLKKLAVATSGKAG